MNNILKKILKETDNRFIERIFINISNTLNTFYSNFVRNINIKIKRGSRKVNFSLIKYTGYNFSQFSDAFSVSSLFLILIKLLVRIGGENTTWQVNIFLLLLGMGVSLNFNLIVKIRNRLRTFWKKGLGYRFYYQQAIGLDLFREPYTEEIKSLPNFSLLNKIFHEVFYFLILIRLFIISEPYLFSIFNFVVTYFLIVNKYLILSSLFSVILVLSRFTFHLSDHTMKDFITVIHPLVNLEGNEVLKPTYENAQFVSLLVARMFEEEVFEHYGSGFDPEKWKGSRQDFDPKAFFDKLRLTNSYLPNLIQVSNIQFKQSFINFLYFTLHEEDETKEETLNHLKDLSLYGRHLLFFTRTGFIERVKKSSEEFNTNYVYYEEAKQSAFSLFAKEKKNKWLFIGLLSILILIISWYFWKEQLESDFIKATITGEILTTVRVSAKDISFFRNFLLETPFSPISSKADNHDHIVVVTREGLYFHTLTTIRDPAVPILGKIVINMPYGISASGSFGKLTTNKSQNEISDFLNNYPKASNSLVSVLLQGYLTHFNYDLYTQAKYHLSPETIKAFEEYHKLNLIPTTLVQHTSFRLLQNSLFEKDSTKQIVNDSFQCKFDYYELALNSKLPASQKDHFERMLEDLTLFEGIKNEILNVPVFPVVVTSSPQVEQTFQIYSEIISSVKKEREKPFFNTEMKTFCNIKKTSLQEEKKLYSNLQHISKNHGGIGNPQSTPKASSFDEID